jgi:hypothetical protein
MNPWWVCVGFSVFLIGVTKSGFGGGIGLTIVPLTAIAMGHIPEYGSAATIGLLLPLLIVGDLIAVWQYRRLFAVEKIKRLFPGTALGVVLGGALLWALGRATRYVGATILIVIGIECIALVGLHWWLLRHSERDHLMREPLRSHWTGAYAGVSSTLAHAAGPIISMYLLPLGLDRRLFVGTSAVYFFLLNTSKLPAYWLSGQFARAELTFSLRFLPIVLAGALFGVWVNRKLSDRIFTQAVYVFTFLLGWYVLADGIVKLVTLLASPS